MPRLRLLLLSIVPLAVFVVAAALTNSAPMYAAAPAHTTIPHVDCSYPGAPDCNMGPPSGGNGSGSTGCGMTCGGGSSSGSGNNSNCLVSLNGTCLISGGNTPPQTQGPPCTSSLFGCQAPASNLGVTSGGSCSGGQVPANQLGIASTACINPSNSGTTSGGPPPLQTKSCPGYAQQFPAAQNCPVPLPSGSGCDIGVRHSLDEGPAAETQAQQVPCGGAQTNPLGVASPTPCNTGIAPIGQTCKQCDDGSNAFPDCPPGTMSTPCSPGQGVAPPGQACTLCSVDNSLAYPPSACPKPPPPPAPSPSPAVSAGQCGGSSLLLPAMDLRVGDGPSVCVNCFLPGATTGTLMSSGDCILAGGSLTPPVASGGGTQTTASSCADQTGPFICVNCFLPGATAGTLMSSGDCTLAGGDWHATASTGLPADLNTGANSPYSTCVGLSNVGGILGGPGIAALSGGEEFCQNLAKAVPPSADANSYIACVTAALFPNATRAGSSTSSAYANSNINPDDAKQICANLVPSANGGTSSSTQSPPTTGSSSSTPSNTATSTGVSRDFENQCIAVFGPFGCAGIDLEKLNACVTAQRGSNSSQTSQTSNNLVNCGTQQGAIPLPGTDIPNAGG